MRNSRDIKIGDSFVIPAGHLEFVRILGSSDGDCVYEFREISRRDGSGSSLLAEINRELMQQKELSAEEFPENESNH